VPLEKIAPTKLVQVDTPDTAPTADPAEQGLAAPPAPEPATIAPKAPQNPPAAPLSQASAPAQPH